MSSPYLVPCRVIDSIAVLFQEMQDAVIHRISCDIGPYEEAATEAETLLQSLDAVRLLFIRSIDPSMLGVDPLSANEFRKLEQSLEAGRQKGLRVFVGECFIAAHEVTWSDAALHKHRPSLGARTDAKAAIIHVSKSPEPVIHREVTR